MPTCAVFGCLNDSIKTDGSNISYHEFPTDQCLAKQWISACKRKEIFLLTDATICSAHFSASNMDPDHLSSSNHCRLKPDALPTENLPADPDSDSELIKFSSPTTVMESKNRDIKDEVRLKMERLCRTCLVEGGSEVMRGLFSVGDPPSNREYHEMITSCTGILITKDDGLPRQLCVMCADEITNLFTFKTKCARVDVCLRKLLRNPDERGLKDLLELSRHGDTEKDLFFVNTDDTDTLNNHNKKKRLMDGVNFIKTSPESLDHDTSALKNTQRLPSKRLTSESTEEIRTPVKSIQESSDALQSGFDEFYNSDDELNMPNASFDPLNLLSNDISKMEGKRKFSTLEQVKNPEPVVAFACRNCEMHFLSFDELCTHNLTHPHVTDDLKLVCRYCDESFTYQRLVIPHIRSAHADIARFQCGYCGNKWKIFDQLKYHLANHSTGDSFFKIDNTNPRIKQEICSDDDNYTLDTFISGAHSNQSESENSSSRPNKKSKTVVSKKNELKKSNKPKCHICIKLFKDHRLLKRHLLEEHQIENINTEENSENILSDCTTVKLEHNSSPDVISKEKSVMKEVKLNVAKLKKENKKKGRGRGSFYCDLCDRSFRTQEVLTRHSATHDPNKPHRCQFGMCRWSFKTEFDLLVHVNIYHSEGSKIECSICQKTFKHSQNLRQHMMTHRPTKRYKCSYCPKGFTHLQHLKSHERLHRPDLQPYLCSECGSPFLTKDRLKYHMKIHSDKILTCDICVKTFNSITGYNYHLKIHSGERPHMCQICGKTFKIPSELKKHTSNIHERVKPKGVIENHPMMCKVCGDVKNSVPELTQHMKIHTSQHYCPICPKNFSLEKNLTMHMRTHPLGTRSFVCGKCNSAYNTRSCLFTHEIRCLKTREFLPCTFCDKTFATKPELIHHTRTHTGEKPFVCTECGRAFARNGTLQGHMRTHTGEKPFECRVCDRAFCTTGALRFHMKSHFTLLQEEEILSKISSGELKLTTDTSKSANVIKWEVNKAAGDNHFSSDVKFDEISNDDSKTIIQPVDIEITAHEEIDKHVTHNIIIIPPSDASFPTSDLVQCDDGEESQGLGKKNSIVLQQLGSSNQRIIIEVIDESK